MRRESTEKMIEKLYLKENSGNGIILTGPAKGALVQVICRDGIKSELTGEWQAEVFVFKITIPEGFESAEMDDETALYLAKAFIPKTGSQEFTTKLIDAWYEAKERCIYGTAVRWTQDKII